jgi:hypothetical protein
VASNVSLCNAVVRFKTKRFWREIEMSDLSNWATRMKELRAQKRRVKDVPREQAKLKVDVDVSGIGVGHSLDEFAPGERVILTLADSHVLDKEADDDDDDDDDDDGDDDDHLLLINTRKLDLRKELNNAPKKGSKKQKIDWYDDDNDESALPLGKDGDDEAMLDKFDRLIDGKQGNFGGGGGALQVGFRIGQEEQIGERREASAGERLAERTLHVARVSEKLAIANDYEVQTKKKPAAAAFRRSKKRRERAKKRSVSLIDELVGTAAEASDDNDHGSRVSLNAILESAVDSHLAEQDKTLRYRQAQRKEEHLSRAVYSQLVDANQDDLFADDVRAVQAQAPAESLAIDLTAIAARSRRDNSTASSSAISLSELETRVVGDQKDGDDDQEDDRDDDEIEEEMEQEGNETKVDEEETNVEDDEGPTKHRRGIYDALLYWRRVAPAARGARVESERQLINESRDATIVVERDRFGRVMTERERYKKAARKFHKTKAGRARQAREWRKFQREQRIARMNGIDTPLNSAAALAEAQRRNRSAFVTFDQVHLNRVKKEPASKNDDAKHQNNKKRPRRQREEGGGGEENASTAKRQRSK